MLVSEAAQVYTGISVGGISPGSNKVSRQTKMGADRLPAPIFKVTNRQQARLLASEQVGHHIYASITRVVQAGQPETSFDRFQQ